jgi:uncharacterized OsmC-like protein
MNLKQKINLFRIFHLIKFSQEYLIKIFHPEDKMRCPIHFCLGQEVLAACLRPMGTKNHSLNTNI